MIGQDMKMLTKQKMIQHPFFVYIRDTIFLNQITVEAMRGINGIENIFGHSPHIQQAHLITTISSLAKDKLITIVETNHTPKAEVLSLSLGTQRVVNKQATHLNLVMKQRVKSLDQLCMEQLCIVIL